MLWIHDMKSKTSEKFHLVKPGAMSKKGMVEMRCGYKLKFVGAYQCQDDLIREIDLCQKCKNDKYPKKEVTESWWGNYSH